MQKPKKQNPPKPTSKPYNPPSITPKKIGNYKIISKIGKGSYANIYKVKKDVPNSPILVLKQILITEEEDSIKEFQTEVQILSQLNSNFIIKYYDSFALSSSLNIITEYCDHGDLNDLLARQFNLNKRFDENLIWKIFIQTSLGLSYIHQQNILHRDIKAKNIFLNKSLDVKIGDLGIAKILQNTVHARTFIGTPYYISPELCKDLPYDKKSDVWALGCVLYEMVMLKHPFDAETQLELYTKIINDDYEEVDDYYSKGLVKFIEMMLQKDYHKRPGIEEVIVMDVFQRKMKELGIKEHNSGNSGNNSNKKYNDTICEFKEKQILNTEECNNNSNNNAVNCSNISNGNNKRKSSNVVNNSNSNMVSNSNKKSSNSKYGIKSKTPTSQKIKKISSIDMNYQRFKQQQQQHLNPKPHVSHNNNKYIQHLPKARNINNPNNNNNNPSQKQNPSTSSNNSSNSNPLNISTSNALKHFLHNKIDNFNSNNLLHNLNNNNNNPPTSYKSHLKTSSNSKDRHHRPSSNTPSQSYAFIKKKKRDNLSMQLSSNAIPQLTSSTNNYQSAIINHSIPSPIQHKKFIRIAKKPKSHHPQHKQKISEQLSKELNELKINQYIKKGYKLNISKFTNASGGAGVGASGSNKKSFLSDVNNSNDKKEIIQQVRTIQTIMTNRTNGSNSCRQQEIIKSEKKYTSPSKKMIAVMNGNNDDSFTNEQGKCINEDYKGSCCIGVGGNYNNSHSSDNDKENVVVIKDTETKSNEDVIKEINELLILYRKYNEKLNTLHQQMNNISREICYKVFDMYHQLNNNNNNSNSNSNSNEDITEQIEKYVHNNIKDSECQKEFMNAFYNYILYEIKFKNINNELHSRNMSDNLD